MTYQSITIQLPEPVYQHISQRAWRKQRTVEDEVLSVVVNTLPTFDDLPADLADSLTQLRFLTDAELWQAARTTLPARESQQMQQLVIKQQQQGLTMREQRKAEDLLAHFHRTTLVRAQAALLLKERGYNIESLRSTPGQ
jgi:hypothetical protein